MVVDRFARLDQLDLIRSRWTELYLSDPSANVFLSWEWVSACLNTETTPWLILGVRDGGPHVAFLPLRFGRVPPAGPTIIRKLSLGLSPRVDFTGMLAVADVEPRFLAALAGEIKSLTWDKFVLNNCADSRIAGLVNELNSSNYRITRDEPTPCPYVQLPSSWDEYIGSRGKSTRRTIRARLRKLKSLPGYRLCLASPDEAASAIDGLLRLHRVRWKKGSRASRSVSRDLLGRCYGSDCFRIYAIYHGDALMAAQGFFVDRPRRTAFGYMIAYDPQYARYSPGMMLACASIRCAIQEGYERFNLSRGAQSYKLSLATNVEYITNTTVSRRNLRVTVVDAGRRVASSAKRLARKLFVRRKSSP